MSHPVWAHFVVAVPYLFVNDVLLVDVLELLDVLVDESLDVVLVELPDDVEGVDPEEHPASIASIMATVKRMVATFPNFINDPPVLLIEFMWECVLSCWLVLFPICGIFYHENTRCTMPNCKIFVNFTGEVCLW